MSRTRLKLPSLAAIGLSAALLIAAGASGAAAQRLITGDDIADGTVTAKDVKDKSLIGKDVKDNSLTGKDVKDNSLTGKDVIDGSLSKADFSGSVVGPQGPAGPQGPGGAQGPAGKDGTNGGPDSIRTWTVQFTANGSNGRDPQRSYDYSSLVTSSEKVPPRTRIETINVVVTSGDFSSCTWAYVGLGAVEPSAVQRIVLAQPAGSGTTPTYPGVGFYTTGDTAESLALIADCYFYDPGTNQDLQRPIPSFQATITFSFTSVAGITGSPFS